ncbi:MAG: sterol desaturase family protein [Myxococcales bacterium]|nr:sterol desaturase family protein [Myxococcales bacterium]MCB9627005.1 sterol desaturase family protein [Sandaracinaceae bacterium]
MSPEVAEPSPPLPAAVEPALTGLADASWPRRVFAYAIFPVAFFGALLITYACFQEGRAPALATLPGIAFGTLMVILGEWVQPRSALWSKSYGDTPTDLKHVLFSQLLPPPLVELALKATAGVAAVLIAERLGRGLWPVGIPFVLQVALAAVIGEFGQYWWHRLCHESLWFWRFHVTHHSAPRLWWLNAARFHPLDTVFSYTLTILPLILLGCPPEVVAMMATFTAVHGVFQHANIDLRLGPLNWIFSMAELHRWHHSRTLSDANTNYGANIIFWDIVFGTRHLPKDRVHPPADVGFLGDTAFPTTYVGQLWTPFRWGALLVELDQAARSTADTTDAQGVEDAAPASTATE